MIACKIGLELISKGLCRLHNILVFILLTGLLVECLFV